MGLLQIKGTIDLAQFWPDGESDADTTKIKVAVGPNSFRFAADGKTFKPTKAFQGAHVVGKSTDTVIDKNGRITVRLQGIDAPELHYRAGPLSTKRPEVTAPKRTAYNAANAKPFRQYLAESATVALRKKLDGFANANSILSCTATSLVDAPFEVIDTYGRFVANINVGSGAAVDINKWLAEEGWVLPTFYSSMSEEEIDSLIDASKKGRKKKGRVWEYYKKSVSGFDARMLFRKGGPLDAAHDKGPALMPKLFRRQVAYEMEKAAKISAGTFKAFLEKTPDYCFDTEDFKAAGVHSATPRTLDEFMSGNTFTPEPQDIVFKEKFSDLVNAKGKKVVKW